MAIVTGKRIGWHSDRKVKMAELYNRRHFLKLLLTGIGIGASAIALGHETKTEIVKTPNVAMSFKISASGKPNSSNEKI